LWDQYKIKNISILINAAIVQNMHKNIETKLIEKLIFLKCRVLNDKGTNPCTNYILKIEETNRDIRVNGKNTT